MPKVTDFAQDIPTTLKRKLGLEDVKQVEVATLIVNPKNAEYFEKETDDYFERLQEDIRKRGVIVPLIANKDGVLLAGHNRLKIAQRVGLKYVPVQYVKDNLSEEQEREFLIKDNLFRRQFSGQEWMDIYRKLYPNFEQRLASHGGHNKKNKQVDTVHLPPLTAKKIALDTGQKLSAVQKQLQREKAAAPKKPTRSKQVDTVHLLSQNAKKTSAKQSVVTLKRECAQLLKFCDDEKMLRKIQVLLSKNIA